MNRIRLIGILLLSFILSACGGGSGGSTESASQPQEIDDNANKPKVSVLISVPEKFTGVNIYIAKNDSHNTTTLEDGTDFLVELGDSYTVRASTEREATFKCYGIVHDFVITEESTALDLNAEDFCFERTTIASALNNVADLNLRTCIENLNASYVDDVTILDCEDESIKTLEGINEFRFLTHVLLEGNSTQELTSVSLDLHELFQVRIVYGAISEVSFNTPRLKHLNLTGNPISEINLDQLTTLEGLEIGHTNITSIDTSKLLKLEQLDVSGLTMDLLDLTNTPTLKSLEMHHTKATGDNTADIKHIIIDNNHEELSVDVDGVEKLTFGENLSLRAISCDCEKLASILIPATTEVSRLELRTSRPLNMQVDIPRLTNLTTLNISAFGLGYNLLDLSQHTQLESLTLEYLTLGDLKLPATGKIKYLDLDWNDLTKVPTNISQSLLVDEHVYVSLGHLKLDQAGLDELEGLKTTFPNGVFTFSSAE